MTCGCRPSPARHGIANRAAMCQTCPQARRETGAAVECLVLGKPIEDVVRFDDACPANRWPDANGEVRWGGLRWLGVPEPIRWRLVWALGREPRGLDGCGCLAAVKGSRAGPWLEPYLEGLQALRTRLAGFMGDWRAAMAGDDPVTQR